jgi:predicted DCC family thiol-disulfide oxidoreductase YuxK
MMQAIGAITVVYDADCGLCARLRNWIWEQDAMVPVEFVPANSPEARQRFGRLPVGELAVIGDTGEVWLGDSAWIVCLWALREYRELAVRLTTPVLLTLAREAFSAVSKNRKTLSSLLRWGTESEVERALRSVTVARCLDRN